MTSTRTIAISTSSFGKESASPLERLRAAGFEVRANPYGRTLTPDEAKLHLAGVSGLVAGTEKLTGALLGVLPDLKVISRVGTGIDNIDLVAAKQLGIEVLNTPDAHVDAVAELAMGGILTALRGVARSDTSIRTGGFEKPMGRLLRGKTVGLVGFGKVAKALARLLAPWNTTLLASDIACDVAVAASLGVRYVELDELLASSDLVSLHLPYSKAAHHVIGPAQLAKLKSDAILVNTSRGGLIDEEALVAHLEAHPKAGAYLDCFEREPYSGALCGLSNVLLTAHIGSYAREARIRMENEAVDNLLRALAT